MRLIRWTLTEMILEAWCKRALSSKQLTRRSAMTTGMGMPMGNMGMMNMPMGGMMGGMMPGMMMGNMPAMMMAPRCTIAMEKCPGGMKMTCTSEDKTGAAMMANLMNMMANGTCSCCMMMNGMPMCLCNVGM